MFDYPSDEITIFEGKPATIYRIEQWFWVVLSFGLAYLYYWFRNLDLRYKITTQRFILVRGLFSKRFDTIEHFRINDLVLKYPLSMRVIGHGILIITSTDRNIPNTTIYGIKNIDKIHESLRKCIISERQRLGIRIHTDI